MKGVSCWFPQSLKRESSNYPQRRVKASDKLGVGIDPLREKVRLQRYPPSSRQGTIPGPLPVVLNHGERTGHSSQVTTLGVPLKSNLVSFRDQRQPPTF